MTPIQLRPRDACERSTLGHWEWDLIVGRRGQSHVGTLVERATRHVMLLHLPDGPGTDSAVSALITVVDDLPSELRRSPTWDCDARSPRQRGLNENTNGPLRQYLPRKTDLSIHAPAQLRAIAAEFYGHPQRALEWKTPHEVMTANVALKA